jgi:hypothetical protein
MGFTVDENKQVMGSLPAGRQGTKYLFTILLIE